MARTCRVCALPKRHEIDVALVEGVSLSNLSAAYKVTEDALARHRDKHLPAALVKAQEAREIARGDVLLSEVKGLHSTTMRILTRAEEAGDLKTVLSAVREARSNLLLLARMADQIEGVKQASDFSEESTEWTRIRSVILEALEPYPEAHNAVTEALRDELND